MAKDDTHMSDWTKGLPSNDELTSLSHMLISPILASAFRIKRDEPLTEEDVHRESQATLQSLFKHNPSSVFDAFPVFQEHDDEGAYDYRAEGRSNALDLRGKRSVEEESRRNRGREDEFGGNQRVEVDFREEVGGNNRRVEDRRRDSRLHAVEDRLEHRGPLRADAPKAPRPNEATGPSKGDAGVGGAAIQGRQTREYVSEEQKVDSAGQSSSPYLLNTLPYGPYHPGMPESGHGGGREDASSREREAPENFELEDAASAGGASVSTDDGSALKRARLVWTPQLHKRFVETVSHLGIKNAVPKTIMQLMNVEGLTRENVASHLQKYRLYLKHMQGLSSDAPSDHLFAPSPLGMRRQDEAFAPPMVPVQFQGIVRPGPFRGYEHMPHGTVAGGYSDQTGTLERQRVAPERESRGHPRSNQPGSSSQYVLPVFPTN